MKRNGGASGAAGFEGSFGELGGGMGSAAQPVKAAAMSSAESLSKSVILHERKGISRPRRRRPRR
jgi:hypothetical protein